MRGHFKEVLFGASCYAALVLSWQLNIEPLLPPRAFDSSEFNGPIVWVEPHGAFLTQGDVRTAETLAIGDSRARSAFLLPEMSQNGFGECAVLWGPAVKLSALLPAARSFPARRLVVCLSVLSLDVPTKGVVALFERGEAPPITQGASDQAEDEWEQKRIEEFVSAGMKQERAERLVEGWVAVYRESILRFGWTPAGIDERLSIWLDAWRISWIQGVPAGAWKSSWVQVFDETLSNDEYRKRLKFWTEAEFKETKSIVTEQLRGLREDGWEITCVRLPISSSMHELESQYIRDEDFEEICRESGVPYLDYSRRAFATVDGSHVIQADAANFARELAADLRRLEAQ